MFCCGDIVVRKQGKPSANRRPVSRNCLPVATLSIGHLHGLPPVLNRTGKRTGAADSSGELGFAASDCFVMRIEKQVLLLSCTPFRMTETWGTGLLGSSDSRRCPGFQIELTRGGLREPRSEAMLLLRYALGGPFGRSPTLHEIPHRIQLGDCSRAGLDYRAGRGCALDGAAQASNGRGTGAHAARVSGAIGAACRRNAARHLRYRGRGWTHADNASVQLSNCGRGLRMLAGHYGYGRGGGCSPGAGGVSLLSALPARQCAKQHCGG